MLNLNLISQEYKDAFRFMAYRRAVLYLGGGISAILVVFIILLVPSFLFLNFQRKEILRELAAEEDALHAFGVVEIEERVMLMNKKTARIRADAARERRASEMAESLAPFGSGVRLGEMRIDFAARVIEIRGIAPTRAALLGFQRSLEEGGLVAKVSAPLSDLIKLTDVAFTLKGVLK